jgi:hypothetical protein
MDVGSAAPGLIDDGASMALDTQNKSAARIERFSMVISSPDRIGLLRV